MLIKAMEDFDYLPHFWDYPGVTNIKPCCKLIKLHGVQKISCDLSTSTFEAIIFDDISNAKYYELFLHNKQFDDFLPMFGDIHDVKIISSTCIQFKLKEARNVSPDVFQFDLIAWL